MKNKHLSQLRLGFALPFRQQLLHRRPRTFPIHKANKRASYLVPQHAHQPLRNLVQLLPVNRQNHVLHGPDPRLAVLRRERQPGLVAGIRAAAVPQRAEEVDDAARRHDDGDGVFHGGDALGVPVVRVRDDDSGAVGGGVVVESNHDALRFDLWY